MTKREYLLVCMLEECAEVQHRITKALRFGLEEIELGQDKNNLERLLYEYADLTAVSELLGEEILATAEYIYAVPSKLKKIVKAKKEKVRRYMAYSVDLGILDA